MGIILKQIFAFLKMLNSDTGTNQLAAGIACGFILGMTPALSLQSLLVFLVIFFFRVQLGAALLTAFFFKFAAYALDPMFDWVGQQVLALPALQSLFTTLYNMPIVPLTRFNNSIVMGSGVVTLILSPLVYLASLILIRKYRVHIVARFKSTKFWKAIQATSLYKWYYKYDELYGSY
ncbi:MAG: TIGR03546 family protein [Bdellovibrionales bacterium]